MRKLLVALIAVVLCLPLSATPVTALSLGVSPSSINVDLSKGGDSIENFRVFYFDGPVSVDVVGVPLSVSPSSFSVDSTSYPVALTFSDMSTKAGDYSGFLRFHGTGVADGNVSLAVDVVVNVHITASVSGKYPVKGGGGGGGGVNVPPRLYNINLCDIGDTTACICWSTNEWSTSQVEYREGQTGTAELSLLDEDYVITHRVCLTDLIPGTTYFYTVLSTDKGRMTSVSDEFTFATSGTAPEPVVPPVPPEPTPVPVVPDTPDVVVPVVPDEGPHSHVLTPVPVPLETMTIVLIIAGALLLVAIGTVVTLQAVRKRRKREDI